MGLCWEITHDQQKIWVSFDSLFPHCFLTSSPSQNQITYWMLEVSKLSLYPRNYDCCCSQDRRPESLLFPQNMPRRRVSVAVVPKFNALNLPGQAPSSSPMPSLPALVSMVLPTLFYLSLTWLLWRGRRWGQGQQGQDISGIQYR